MKLLDTPIITGKGIESYQSSQLKISKRFLNEMLKKILIDNVDERVCENLILEYKKKILTKNIQDIDDLVITKKVGRMPETYKNLPAHVALAIKRKEKGQTFYTSMRVAFIVISEKPLKIIHKDDFAGVYDEKYYWTKCIYPPTYRLLKVVFPNHDWDKYLKGEMSYQSKL